jgi:hypothetical protein
MISTIFKWAPRSIFNPISSRKKPIHVIFSMVDHYEPGTGKVSTVIAKERVNTLLTKYPDLVLNHKDSAGIPAQRTWFYPPHYHHQGHLKKLVSLCEKGYGEIELHLHHGKHAPDDSDNLRKTLQLCVEEYSQFGIFGTENGEKKYGFIHGDWALANSRGNQYCGVNNEIEILKETGCYADFTFPSLNEANPSKINSIYYAKSDSQKPKSHDAGINVKAGGGKSGDLMLVEGPLHPFFKTSSPLSLRVFGDEVDGSTPVTPQRVDAWIKTGIHVEGKDNWVFVKTHTHGATDDQAVLGEEMDHILSHLENKYNDGENYILHYVTSREMYNIIKAIEAGLSGDNPQLHKNFKIQPPQYNSSPQIEEASKNLQELVARTYKG